MITPLYSNFENYAVPCITIQILKINKELFKGVPFSFLTIAGTEQDVW
tara:strand:- start:1083 stop:1226 length:144 start_codon:yes stop_codon:yes gene_type:complete